MDSYGRDGLVLEVVDGPRARGAFLLRVVMDPPWAVRVASQLSNSRRNSSSLMRR